VLEFSRFEHNASKYTFELSVWVLKSSSVRLARARTKIQ
jgi:hypothetical protein